MRKSKYIKYILILMLIVLFFSAIKINVINVDILSGKDSASIHFNLITVNSIFAGFLFSSLALLIGLNSTKTLIVLERTNRMESIYKNITRGLMSSIISIVLSLICIFIIPNIEKISLVNKLPLITKKFIPGLVLLFIIFTIVSFLIATRDIKFIISSVRRKSTQNTPSKESIQKTLESIK